MNNSFDKEYKKLWDDRYGKTEYAYGKKPNRFFQGEIQKLKPATILLPADGEARNGVYAAELGWQVTSLDLSIEAKHKALKLASERNVAINYLVGDLENLDFGTSSFDVIALIYAHFSPAKKSILHKKLSEWLKPGGTLIFEAFSKAHLPLVQANPKVGGPKGKAMLFSKEELLNDFKGYEIETLVETEIPLQEGVYHNGKGAVIRFVGKKQS
ncbi:class I SAM-dependent methyltransferase [Echinicola rosea]|uniref:Methyltransferase n=1 Tax=Echinicola rosea TaxID=1807691 RepID=A0ABQ1VC84_9BACT|nr:class I SAM-dependent methyltransferase [Echinicola rosea]GGF47347.1 methyltransferase [Echinicola rosea]